MQWRMLSLGWSSVLCCGIMGHVFFLSLNCKHVIIVKLLCYDERSYILKRELHKQSNTLLLAQGAHRVHGVTRWLSDDRSGL